MRTEFKEGEEEHRPYRSEPPSIVPAVPTVQEIVEEVNAGVEQDLRQVDPETFSFSPQAFSALQKNIKAYVRDLITESTRESKRQQADVVSRSHVERAAGFLVTGSEKKRAKHMGTIGGLLAGAGGGLLLSMVQAGKYDTVPLVIAVLLLAIGLTMIGYQIGKE